MKTMEELCRKKYGYLLGAMVVGYSPYLTNENFDWLEKRQQAPELMGITIRTQDGRYFDVGPEDEDNLDVCELDDMDEDELKAYVEPEFLKKEN